MPHLRPGDRRMALALTLLLPEKLKSGFNRCLQRHVQASSAFAYADKAKPLGNFNMGHVRTYRCHPFILTDSETHITSLATSKRLLSSSRPASSVFPLMVGVGGFDISRLSSPQAGWHDAALSHPHEYHIEALLQGRLEIDPRELVAHRIIGQRIRATGITGGAELDDYLHRGSVACGFGGGDG